MNPEEYPGLDFESFERYRYQVDLGLPETGEEKEIKSRLAIAFTRTKIRFGYSEFLIPPEFFKNVSRRVMDLSENVPCGINGIKLIIHFEDNRSNQVKFGEVIFDYANLPMTELLIVVKEDESSFIYRFLRDWFRVKKFIMAPEFTITKTKLYRDNYD